MDGTDFSNIFVKFDEFEEEEDDDEDLFDNNGTNFARYEKAVRSSTNENAICKIFNPKALQFDLSLESGDKNDQCWYRQLILLREAIFLKKINHPTIVNFKGFCLYNPRFKYDEFSECDVKTTKRIKTNPTIFLEFLENKSLKCNMYEGKLNLDPVKRQICIIGLVSAVRFLHSRKIIHRSLNPATVWLDKDFYPKVFDFSTSRVFSSKNDTPKTILKNESINYQAPELFESNFDKYDDSIDIFSLGRLIYLMITGYEPYRYPDDPYKICHGYGLQEPILASKHPFLPESISNDFRNLLERCWSFNPHDRPTAAEIYNLFLNEDGLIINEIESDDDFLEIRKYVESIEKFEREMPIRSNSKLRILKTFEFEIPLIDQNIPKNIAEQIQALLNYTSSNFASRDESEVLRLFIEMAKNQSIFQSDYLQKVINFVNNTSQNGNSLADDFLKLVFGEYCVSSDIIEIRNDMFSKSNETLNIPPTVKKICANAFAGNKDLVRINIPNSVTVIEDEAFCGCTNLSFVNIPRSIEGDNLGKGVFKNCTNLKYIQIPSSITIIKEESFKNDESLVNLILNDGLQTIGKSAFNGCKSLKYVEIPKTIKLIQKEAFYNCPNLSKIYFRNLRKPKTEKKGLPSKYKVLP